MRVLRALVVALALVLAPGIASAQALPETPAGYVTDAAHVLSDTTRASLEARLGALDASTTEQVAVVTVPDLGGDYIEHYAAQLFEKWGIGRAKEDNGVLLLVAVEDRQLRIEVGYGLEGALPDSVANAIIQDDMVPLLKQGDYDGAVQKGVDSIVAAIDGEYAASGQEAQSSIDPWAATVFGIIAIQWLAAILGRSKSWWLGGVLGGIGGLVLSSIFGWWLLGGAALTLVLIVFGFLFDFLVSRSFTDAMRSGSTPPWWTGGGGIGGSRSGGFGGFGGGMSGGGGASGRW